MLKSRQLYSKHWSGDAHHIMHVMSEICQGDQRKLLTLKITRMINTVTSISNFIAPQRKLGLFPTGRPFEGICMEEVPPFGCRPCPRCTTVVGSVSPLSIPCPLWLYARHWEASPTISHPSHIPNSPPILILSLPRFAALLSPSVLKSLIHCGAISSVSITVCPPAICLSLSPPTPK